jgi:hypothetical protein
VGEDGDFDIGLLHDLLALLHDFQGELLFGFMVQYLDNFTEGALVDGFNDLIAICDMVSDLIPIKLAKSD